MRTFISYKEARKIVLDSAVVTGTEKISFEAAIGRTLAQDIVSNDVIPPFDNSAMDGFAVRHADTNEVPARLKIVADIPAGAPFSGKLERGEAARIMTGAEVPDGADAIVPVEKTRAQNPDSESRSGEDAESGFSGDQFVWITDTARRDAHIRHAGEAIQRGDCIFKAGDLVSPPAVGMLATLGFTQVDVHIKPRVAVISTGDEIVSPDTKPGAGQIRNSNGPTLAAQVRAAGAEAAQVLHVGDNQEAIRRVIKSLDRIDLVVFSGGVSMGEYDYVRTELDAMGAEWAFWKVKQRPGKPLAYGVLDDMRVVGLPGNPVSSSICFEVYVRPLLARMSGTSRTNATREPALLTTDIPKAKTLHTFARGVLSAPPLSSDDLRMRVAVTGNQSSSRISSIVDANCIIHLPEGLEEARAGMMVEVERLQW